LSDLSVRVGTAGLYRGHLCKDVLSDLSVRVGTAGLYRGHFQ
jgi:hypothetical protein